MKRVLLVATGLLSSLTATASAGGYLGRALGTQPSVNDQMATIAVPTGRSLRALAGTRFGNIGLEGALNGFNVISSGAERTVYQLSGALKLSLPLGNNFEVFGRA